jgi:hypothetical protein
MGNTQELRDEGEESSFSMMSFIVQDLSVVLRWQMALAAMNISSVTLMICFPSLIWIRCWETDIVEALSPLPES